MVIRNFFFLLIVLVFVGCSSGAGLSRATNDLLDDVYVLSQPDTVEVVYPAGPRD